MIIDHTKVGGASHIIIIHVRHGRL